MRILLLVKDRRQWIVRYDEPQHTVTVEGPDPEARQLHRWLTTPKHVIDRETGTLIPILPVDRWAYMQQVLEHDIYTDLQLKWVEEGVDEASE